MTDATINPAGMDLPEEPRLPTRVHAFLSPSPQGRVARATYGGKSRGVLVPVTRTLVEVFVLASVALTALGVLVRHVLEHGYVGVWDHHVTQWFVVHATTLGNRVSGDLTFMADTVPVVVVAAIVTIVLVIRRWGRKSLVLVAGLVIELSVFLTVNSIVARPRPGVRHLGGTPSTYSFPSGHTAATIVLYGGIAVIITAATQHRGARVAAWIIAVLLTVAVALSRVYRGEHYPTDVIGGALLGIIALASAVWIIRIASAQHPHNQEARAIDERRGAISREKDISS